MEHHNKPFISYSLYDNEHQRNHHTYVPLCQILSSFVSTKTTSTYATVVPQKHFEPLLRSHLPIFAILLSSSPYFATGSLFEWNFCNANLYMHFIKCGLVPEQRRFTNAMYMYYMSARETLTSCKLCISKEKRILLGWSLFVNYLKVNIEHLHLPTTRRCC